MQLHACGKWPEHVPSFLCQELRQAVASDKERSAPPKRYFSNCNVAVRKDSHNGWTDLHYAVARSNEDLVSSMLASQADVHARTLNPDSDFFLRGGLTPLHVWTCFSRSVQIAELLVSYRADVNSPADRGWTPLMVACEVGSEVVVQALLQLKADPNGSTVLNTRPLSVAICYDFPCLVDPLLEARADAWYEWVGIGTLHQLAAAGSGRCLQRLLKEGLDLNAKAYFKMGSKAGVAHFLYRLWDRDMRRDYALMHGGTPLVCAAARGNCEALQALIEASADVRIPNAFGQTAYQISLQTGHLAHALRQAAVSSQPLRTLCPVHANLRRPGRVAAAVEPQ